MTKVNTKKLQKQLKILEGLDFTESVVKGGEVLMRKSMDNAPVDTGFLKSSHVLRVTGEEELVVEVEAEYSGIVEYRQPYMRPAIDGNEAVIVRAIGEDVQATMEKSV